MVLEPLFGGFNVSGRRTDFSTAVRLGFFPLVVERVPIVVGPRTHITLMERGPRLR